MALPMAHIASAYGALVRNIRGAGPVDAAKVRADDGQSAHSDTGWRAPWSTTSSRRNWSKNATMGVNSRTVFVAAVP